MTVRRRRFANADTGFAVLECEAEEEEVVLVGPVAHLDEEDRAFVLESELVPTVRLKRIFRQAAGSMIVVGAHGVRRGNVPSFKRARACSATCS